jgi:asparagine synthetase B (glutamine-hydrolysing)
VTVTIVGDLDPDLAWDGSGFYGGIEFAPDQPVPLGLRGAATAVCGDPIQGWRILRDPLGINKLFWTQSAGGDVHIAARPHRLIGAGDEFESIRAVPRGVVFDVTSRGRATTSLLPKGWTRNEPSSDGDWQRAARAIRTTLDLYLSAIAGASAQRVFVCLSGGLDSTGIAVLAREHFPGAVFVSFDLSGPGRQSSEDRSVARRVAADLALPLLEVDVTVDELLENLDLVLREGIDWRGFNVHAALVNAAIAAGIRAEIGDASPALVLTGDLANEFLADYSPETFRGVTHYALPKLPPWELRASLVRGLDTSHREVGIFTAWGLTVVQPYAVAVDHYLALSAGFLADDDRKRRLCAAIFGRTLPDYVLARPKVRAQVGGRDGGVLAACIDSGVDDQRLRTRFAALHRTNVDSLDRFIRAGLYRSGLPSLMLESRIDANQ